MFKYRVENLEEIKKQLDPKKVDKANYRAANKAATKTRTFISKTLRDIYNINPKAVSRRVKFLPASLGRAVSELRYVGPQVGLINFAAKPKKISLSRKPRKGQKGRKWGRIRTGVTVKVRKTGGRKLVKSKPGFIATGANGNQHIYYRTGKARDKLRSMKSLSVPEMVRYAEMEGAGSKLAYEQKAAEEYDVEFDRLIRLEMGRAS